MTIETWDELIRNPSAKTDTTTLQETCGAIFSMVAAGHAWKIDFRPLKNLPVNGEHLAMALRCTASRQKWITGWYMALDQAAVVLTKEGKDPNDALFGLRQTPPLPAATPALKYYWTFTCLQGNAVISKVVFSTEEPAPPTTGEVFNALLALGKVPQQGYPPMTHHIDTVGWEGAIPHLKRS